MMQLSEGFDKGAAVFNHWKVHHGRDADHLARADSNGVLLDDYGAARGFGRENQEETGAKSNDGGASDDHGDSDV
jgi:hypothetical protein